MLCPTVHDSSLEEPEERKPGLPSLRKGQGILLVGCPRISDVWEEEARKNQRHRGRWSGVELVSVDRKC